MLTKTKVIDTVNALPDTFPVDEIIERLLLLAKIEAGLNDSKNNRIVSEEELTKRLPAWLS
jgi:predicted transcriptional regulator